MKDNDNGSFEFNMLPQDCLSTILSMTLSPADVCRISAVSTGFRSSAESDHVWEKLLPPDYQDIVSRAADPLKFASKKQLFLCFCSSVSIDGGNKIFTVEKSSGLKSYILSARELSIEWMNFPMYWTWRSVPKSRFKEVAELRCTHWLEIRGKMKTRMLSPSTTYSAHLIFSIQEHSFGIDKMPMVVSVELDQDQASYSDDVLIGIKANEEQKGRQMLASGKGKIPRMRKDGWMEIELGKFFTGEVDSEVKMSLMEIRGCHLKGGLIIEGLEVRPS
ncbi:hypothetical protein Dimus_012079 [Dionaea muscipula]